MPTIACSGANKFFLVIISSQENCHPVPIAQLDPWLDVAT
jgi:hypothetical protein